VNCGWSGHRGLLGITSCLPLRPPIPVPLHLLVPLLPFLPELPPFAPRTEPGNQPGKRPEAPCRVSPLVPPGPVRPAVRPAIRPAVKLEHIPRAPFRLSESVPSDGGRQGHVRSSVHKAREAPSCTPLGRPERRGGKVNSYAIAPALMFNHPTDPSLFREAVQARGVPRGRRSIFGGLTRGHGPSALARTQ
jgi:hypothetical protein